MTQCINCRSEINVGAMVCPYCHTDPSSFGSQPYSGVQPHNGVYDPDVAAIAAAAIGGIACVICLPVGLGILGLGAIRYAYDKIKGR
jgi:hypothetical protein